MLCLCEELNGQLKAIRAAKRETAHGGASMPCRLYELSDGYSLCSMMSEKAIHCLNGINFRQSKKGGLPLQER